MASGHLAAHITLRTAMFGVASLEATIPIRWSISGPEIATWRETRSTTSSRLRLRIARDAAFLLSDIYISWFGKGPAWKHQEHRLGVASSSGAYLPQAPHDLTYSP